MVFSDVGGYPRKMARHTERCFYSYNARGALPAEEALQESPQYRFVDGLVNADTVFDTRVVVAVNSIYYPGVFAAVRRHVGSGGEAYVIVHCADHSGHTWGDEAYVSVCNGQTTLTPTESGEGYCHASWPYSEYACFVREGLWFHAIHRVAVGCCHTVGLYRVSMTGEVHLGTIRMRWFSDAVPILAALPPGKEPTMQDAMFQLVRTSSQD